MKRCLSEPCLEDDAVKRIRSAEERAETTTARDYLELALTRVVELQRKIEEGTYEDTEVYNDNGDLDESDDEQDLTKEIIAEVFQDLPGTSAAVAKIADKETRWRNFCWDTVRNEKLQLLGFDTCRKLTLQYMKTIIRESRGRSSSPEMAKPGNPKTFSSSRNESSNSRNGNPANDARGQETDAQNIQMRMLKSLDLHLAAKQRDYTAKLMGARI